MIFPQNGKISQKLSLILAMLPDANFAPINPNGQVPERIIYGKAYNSFI